MKVLVACEYSGIVRAAFCKAGHDAWSVDLLPTESDYTKLKKKHIIELLICFLSCITVPMF